MTDSLSLSVKMWEPDGSEEKIDKVQEAYDNSEDIECEIHLRLYVAIVELGIF